MDPASTPSFKLPFSALSRGVTLVFSKVMRVKRIDAALRGLPDDSLAKIALSDYETYLAALHGQYGVDVEAFHQELLKTGILDAMFEVALIDADSLALRASFADLFYKYFPAEEASEHLFERIRVAMRASVSLLVKDQALLRFVQLHHKQLMNRLEQIEESLTTRAISTRSENVNDVVAAISRGLLSHYKTLKVETLSGGARNVNISDIYVPPSLDIAITVRQSNALKEAVQAESIESHRSHYGAARRRSTHDLRHLGYTELRRSFRRVVVLGDPGGGKSTLCQRLCYDLAKSSTLVNQHQGGTQHIDGAEQRVPIRVILRLFEQARSHNPQLDLITYIVRDIKHHVGHSEADIYEAIVYLLNTGRAVLAFDGLDEILDTSKRRDYVDLVSALCNAYPLCPVLVTSRVVGYDTAPLPNDFDRLFLQKFDETEIKSYAERFFRHIGNETREQAEAESNRFIFQTQENAADLRRNPLMLGLMLWIFAAKGDVPSNRPAIYSECATLMFDKWDANRGIRPMLPGGFDRAQLFSGIAAKVYPDANLRAGVPKDWLQEHLIAYFSDKFVDKAKAFEAAESLVEFLVGRAWVMMEVGDGVFAFTHQTFLEFFYAKHVSAQFDTVPRLFREIRSGVSKKERDVVNHLALQIKTTGVDRLQSEAISEIVRYQQQLTKDASRLALMNFAARSLEYLTPSEAGVRLLLEQIYDQAVHSRMQDQHLLPIAIVSCNVMRSFARSEVERLLVMDVSGQDEARAKKALLFLRAVPRTHWNKPESVPLPLQRVSTALRSMIEDNMLSGVEWAQAAFSLYGMLTPEALEIWGFQAFDNVSLVSGYEGIEGFEALVLAASQEYAPNYCVAGIRLQTVRETLAAVGKIGFARLAAGQVVGPLLVEPFHGIPAQVWADLLKGFAQEPELWLGAVFVLGHSGVLAADYPGRHADGKDATEAITKRLRLDEKRLASWSGLTPTVRKFINGEAPGFHYSWTPRRPSVVI